MRHFLDFERQVAELELKIDELRRMQEPDGINIEEEVRQLEEKSDRQLRATYAKLTPWQKTQVARHPDRPHATAYIQGLIAEFTPLAGDRAFGDDAAIVGGIGRFQGRSVIVLGTERGADTESRVAHNFGMARPEGYRKARRLIELAGRFALPVLTFVDTAGAFPGIDAEARGQAEAIARSIADQVLMLEHAIYSVISPEGCASILWHDSSQAPAAAEALRLTASDLLGLGIVDQVLPEPLGGAHRSAEQMIAGVGEAISGALATLSGLDVAALRARRQEKYLAMGREAGF